MPLIVTLPYPNTAATVEVVRAGQVLVSVSPLSKTLSDAIEAIPDFGFVENPEERRNALRNKVRAIEQMLSAGANKGAHNALLQDVRPTIQAWLVDGYKKSTPDQLEKSEVLFVIDGVIQRIANLRN